MANREPAIAQIILQLTIQLEQTQRVGHNRAALADFGSDILLAKIEFLDEFAVAKRLFERIEIFPLQIFDQRQLQRRSIIGSADNYRNFFEAGQRSRPPAAFSRN